MRSRQFSDRICPTARTLCWREQALGLLVWIRVRTCEWYVYVVLNNMQIIPRHAIWNTTCHRGSCKRTLTSCNRYMWSVENWMIFACFYSTGITMCTGEHWCPCHHHYQTKTCCPSRPGLHDQLVPGHQRGIKRTAALTTGTVLYSGLREPRSVRSAVSQVFFKYCNIAPKGYMDRIVIKPIFQTIFLF